MSRLSIIIVLVLLVGCGGRTPPDHASPQTSIAVNRYTVYDPSTQAMARWDGMLRMHDPRELSSLRILRFHDGQGVPRYRHHDGSHGWPVLTATGQLAGLLNVRADQTLALALSAEHDGLVNLLIEGDLRTGGTRYLFDEQGAAIMRDWLEARNVLCLEDLDLASAMPLMQPAIIGCAPGRRSTGSTARGGASGTSDSWGGILDPLDLFCEDYGARPGWAPPTYTYTPRPLTPGEQAIRDKERSAVEDAYRAFLDAIIESLGSSENVEGNAPPTQTELEWQVDEAQPTEDPAALPERSREEDVERLWPLEPAAPPANPYEQGQPIDPEGTPSEGLIRFCEYRWSNTPSLRDQLRETLKPECTNPASVEDERQCFGRELSRADIAAELQDRRCSEGDLQRHCEPPTLSQRLNNLRMTPAHGVLEAIEICNPFVCRAPQ